VPRIALAVLRKIMQLALSRDSNEHVAVEHEAMYNVEESGEDARLDGTLSRRVLQIVIAARAVYNGSIYIYICISRKYACRVR